MERILCLAIGYIFGLFQTAYIYGRMNKIDIREHGSGNAGTTNALRVLGKKAGAIVYLGDLFKSVIACWIVRLVFVNFYPDTIMLLVLYTGLGVVIGHIFPCYLKFKGGKGIAAISGILVGVFDIRIMASCLIIFVLTVLITKYVSLGSILLILCFFIEFVIFGFMGSYCLSGFSLYESIFVLFVTGAIAIYKHKDNIVRLIHGEENKIGSSKKKVE